ncbi:STAS domain-containing protein [Streptomyces griseosporeus]|uniref:STAS domain-containing protein n=1 Tax=Streptomyces griseosporeus TaxID=1910 RepID=UPI0037021DB1
MSTEPSTHADTTGTSLIVQVSGDMDWETAPLLREQLLAGLARSEGHMVLDMSAVSFCDSAGLNLLLWIWRKAAEAGTVLALACVPVKVQRMLAMTGVDTVLRVYDTVTAAEEKRTGREGA